MPVESIEVAGLERDFVRHYRFPFDQFQLEAMDHIRSGSSVMVAAPTSAGKTVVAEYALWRTVSEGRRAVYTTPIKALSNQKRRDLESMFPARVGLLTGDRSENQDAAILVMTTEVLRNMLLEDPEALEDVGCVVFDEVHYLADPDRGTIWEECIITSLPHMQLVCLSATIANAEEIAAWISQTHRHIALVRHDERPVPLEHYSFTGGALRLIRDVRGKRVATVPQSTSRKRKRSVLARPEDVVPALRRARLLPAIWFAFTRRGVELDAEACALASPLATGRRREAIENAIAWTLASIPPEDRGIKQLSTLCDLLRHGVGFHHAGLLPPCKELVEDLFVRGFLEVVCATDTLSVGINMPARTVVISSMSRPVGGLLTPNDFSQLTGRAGRRGIDERGAVVILPDPYHEFERGYAMLLGPLEPVRSSFTLRYSTLLSMLGPRASTLPMDRTARGYDGAGSNAAGDAETAPEERLTDLVRSSLRQFQLLGDARGTEIELATVEAELRLLPPIPRLKGRDEELDEYLELQRRLTAAERDRPHRTLGARRGRPERSMGEQRRRHGNVDALRVLLRSHPLHSLASDPTFQSAAAARIDLLRRRNRLLRVVDDARRHQRADAERTARAVTVVLRRLGYLEPSGPTKKAAGLREMVSPSGIVISEMYHAGMLAEPEPDELAEVLSWFACDVDRRRYNSFRLPPHLLHVRSQAEMVFGRVSALEERNGIRLAQGPSNWFWGAALAWCNGDAVDAIVPHIEAGAGDIVSFLNKTIDLIDQLKGLLAKYGDQEMLVKASRARGLLCRGLVAMIRSDPLAVSEDVGETALLAAT